MRKVPQVLSVRFFCSKDTECLFLVQIVYLEKENGSTENQINCSAFCPVISVANNGTLIKMPLKRKLSGLSHNSIPLVFRLG